MSACPSPASCTSSGESRRHLRTRTRTEDAGVHTVILAHCEEGSKPILTGSTRAPGDAALMPHVEGIYDRQQLRLKGRGHAWHAPLVCGGRSRHRRRCGRGGRDLAHRRRRCRSRRRQRPSGSVLSRGLVGSGPRDASRSGRCGVSSGAVLDCRARRGSPRPCNASGRGRDKRRRSLHSLGQRPRWAAGRHRRADRAARIPERPGPRKRHPAIVLAASCRPCHTGICVRAVLLPRPAECCSGAYLGGR